MSDSDTTQEHTGAAEGGQRVVWDDTQMRTTFANVVNGTSTREEVTLLFGTNKTWNTSAGRGVEVALSDRIILTPYAAKRLWILLSAILQNYERNHGELKIEAGPRPEKTN